MTNALTDRHVSLMLCEVQHGGRCIHAAGIIDIISCSQKQLSELHSFKEHPRLPALHLLLEIHTCSDMS